MNMDALEIIKMVLVGTRIQARGLRSVLSQTNCQKQINIIFYEEYLNVIPGENTREFVIKFDCL